MHKKGKYHASCVIMIVLGLFLFMIPGSNCWAQQSVKTPVYDRYKGFSPGKTWYDDRGEVINAHGGGLLYSGNTYYWFGECRGTKGTNGVNVYSSKDLYNWKFEALALSTDSTH